ncbi:MAG: SDR family NAD(P)-dependent oxidoreductase, partial [DPANN group archaeon]|nr:SDR family NAD(P)-dependent oxidoreductase [DPANN group archaeon]
MHILVTGGAGFIGSHVAEALLARGDRVTVIDNLDPYYDPAQKQANLDLLMKKKGFTFLNVDITDFDAVDKVFSGRQFDAIIHLAAKVGVRSSLEDPLGYYETNVKGTLILLETARKHGIGRFIFASSSSVYGNSKKVPFSEKEAPLIPISPYAATKLAGEQLCHTYHHLYGLKVSCLRFFTVYGPRGRPDMAVFKFTKHISEGKPIPVYA